MIPNQLVSSDQSEYENEADFRLVNKLLSTPRYVIPEHLRQKLIGAAGDILQNPEEPATTVLAAARTILLADKHNIEIIKMSIPKKHEHRQVHDYSDEELMEAIKATHKLLPRTIDTEYDGKSFTPAHRNTV